MADNNGNGEGFRTWFYRGVVGLAFFLLFLLYQGLIDRVVALEDVIHPTSREVAVIAQELKALNNQVSAMDGRQQYIISILLSPSYPPHYPDYPLSSPLLGDKP